MFPLSFTRRTIRNAQTIHRIYFDTKKKKKGRRRSSFCYWIDAEWTSPRVCWHRSFSFMNCSIMISSFIRFNLQHMNLIILRLFSFLSIYECFSNWEPWGSLMSTRKLWFFLSLFFPPQPCLEILIACSIHSAKLNSWGPWITRDVKTGHIACPSWVRLKNRIQRHSSFWQNKYCLVYK